MREQWMQMLRKMDKQKWVVCILLGVLFLVMALPVEKKEEDREGLTKKNKENGEIYVEHMEERVESILEKIEGAGDVEVMITLENQGERVVAQDVNRQERTEEEKERIDREMATEAKTIFAGEVPYETKSICPQIRGICVVAQGAKNKAVQVKLYQAVQALFSLEAHKISIVEMGSQEGI